MNISRTSPMKWKRNAVALGAGFLIAVLSANAQQSAGSINGRASKGDVVTVEAKTLGIARRVQIANDGTFQISQLPAGSYQVTITRANGSKETVEVNVSAGEGATAAFGGTQQVVVTGVAARSIDMKSTESSTILTKSEIDRIPVVRDVTAVTLLAPGALQGDSRIGQTTARSGNVASLGGASPAENAYYINGFNVTNIVNGVAFNQVPFEAIGEQQVRTGGYGAEFGRSLGGVISINTKRGTNEWKGGVNLIYTPESLKGSSVYAKANGSGGWDLVDRPGGSDELQANVWAGGPIIKDKLFAFGLIQGAKFESSTYDNNRQTHLKNTTPQYLLKLDWNINDKNLLEFTSFNDKSVDKIDTYNSTVPYETARGSFVGNDEFTSGGQNNILKWTGWLTDNITLSALYGRGVYDRKSVVSSALCPIVQDRRASPTVILGCWTGNGLVPDSDAKDERDAFRLDLEWVLGKHTIRAGLDDETYKVKDGTRYSGGEYFFIQNFNAGSTLNGVTNTTGATQFILNNRTFANGGNFKTKNSAWYIEDAFQVTPNVLATVGLRNESFKNLNANGDVFINVKNTWAPRLGVSWDVNGKSDLKVFANAGRYYIPVYSNTNVRLAGAETDYRDYWYWDGTFSTDGKSVPGKGAQIGSRIVTSTGVTPDPRTVVDPNLKPMHQDEFIVGFQKALANRWSFGAKFTHRELLSAMDDICTYDFPYAWATSAGYSAAHADAIASAVDHCFLYNAGQDLTANVDLDGTGALTAVRIPASALGMPKPKRTYDALELTVEREWDKKWSFRGSYVLAYSKGNTEGYVKSDIGQDDAGISQDFDHPGLMVGSEGYLPNDRRHTFKFFGTYALTNEWQIGGNVVMQSGRPKNCFGFYPAAETFDPAAVGYEDASFYCNGKLVPRGSLGRLPWTYDLSLQAKYSPERVKGLTFSVDVLNILNRRGVRGIEEGGEDAEGTPSPLYQRPILASLQKPRTVRFTAMYEF